ncbi:MAG: hypothetical protein RLZZ450_1798 [Pseudomonadota bacterium]|jgi:hypothetical protein
MKARELGRHRLDNLFVTRPRGGSAPEVVAALGAMQAQDYAGALWAIGLRLPGSTLGDIEQAVVERTIVRTWPMRGTLHFVAAADVGWLLDLLSARVLKAAAKRREGLGLDATTLRKIERTVVHALEGGVALTRDALAERLTREAISPEGGRLYHSLLWLSLHQVLCFGVPEGKQQTSVLLDEWVPTRRRLDKDEALVELATRFLRSHGPATQQDLMRWAGLTAVEAKLGISGARAIANERVEGVQYYFPDDQTPLTADSKGTLLLPGFDEYILGYRDRGMILAAEHAAKIVPGANGVFRPTIVHDGEVVGTWQASVNKKSVRLTAEGFAALSKVQERAFVRAAARYGAFVGRAALVA